MKERDIEHFKTYKEEWSSVAPSKGFTFMSILSGRRVPWRWNEVLTVRSTAVLILIFWLYRPTRIFEAILVMSNQRFFKIVCFRFPTNVPQKIEYIRFLNKIHCQTKTFSFRSQNFWSKSNRFFQFPNFFLDFKKFCSGFRNLWTKSKRFSFDQIFLD